MISEAYIQGMIESRHAIRQRKWEVAGKPVGSGKSAGESQGAAVSDAMQTVDDIMFAENKIVISVQDIVKTNPAEQRRSFFGWKSPGGHRPAIKIRQHINLNDCEVCFLHHTDGSVEIRIQRFVGEPGAKHSGNILGLLARGILGVLKYHKNSIGRGTGKTEV